MYKAIHSLVLITAVAATTQNYRGYYKYEEKNVPMTKRDVSGDFIKFDGPTSRRDANDVSEPIITDECRKIGFCETVENYPVELVEELIEEYPDKRIFHKDEPDNSDVRVAQRLGGTEDPDPTLDLCGAYFLNKAPQAGQDRNNSWWNIINTPNKPVQSFTMEVCHRAGDTCQLVDPAPGYVTECHQKFIYRTVAVLGDIDKRTIVLKELKFPSCCACRLKSK